VNRRARFIAVQALLTVVLMGVIVVTLINPNGDSALFAVDVPSATAPVEQGPPSYERADEGSQGGGDGGRAERGPAAGETGEGLIAPPAAGVAGAGDAGETAPVAPPPGPADEGPSGPAGEQYGDTVARLSEAVD
jgi:hypothetical protein